MALFQINNVEIKAIAACVPKAILRTSDYNHISEQERKMFTLGTGIIERRVTNDNLCTSDMCYNAAQKIRLPIPQYGNFQLKAGQTCIIDIDITLENWFTGPYPLSIANHPVCMTPGELAWNISRNFSGLFSVTNLSIEE